MRPWAGLFLFLLATGLSTDLVAAQKGFDIRVVIDLSASMDRVDPANLRVPAIKLFSNLLPAGSHAGLWTFGRYANAMVKWGVVTPAWRKLADQRIEEMVASGHFSNMERALERATSGWKKTDKGTERMLVLLSAGEITISNNATRNTNSRQAILGKRLDSLVALGVRVHTIALTRFTDQVLLKRLALATSGSFTLVDTAGGLQTALANLFEKITQPDLIAFEGNQFLVDKQIKTMTLLAFKSANARSSVLTRPDGSSVRRQSPGDSKWSGGQGFDLIKLQNPVSGMWRFDGGFNADDRLYIESDLRLLSSPLPAYFPADDKVKINLGLINKGKKITKNSFLKFVNFAVNHVGADGKKSSLRLRPSRDFRIKGQYPYRPGGPLEEGLHQFLFTARGRLFARSKRLYVRVERPVEVKLEPQRQAGDYLLSVRAREEYMVRGSLQIDAILEFPDGSVHVLDMKPSPGWYSSRIVTRSEGIYKARLQVEGLSADGARVIVKPVEMTINGVFREQP